MSVEIAYCVKCQWMLRAAWLQQELLSTFTKEEGVVQSVALAPSWVPGTFVVKVNGDVVWDRRVDGGFPQAKELKQRVRDKLEPGRHLGHNDGHNKDTKNANGASVIPVASVNTSAEANAEANEPDFGSPKLNAKHHTFCEECVEQLPPSWEL